MDHPEQVLVRCILPVRRYLKLREREWLFFGE